MQRLRAKWVQPSVIFASFWVALPVFGMLTPFAYLVSLPLLGDRRQPIWPPLRAFFILVLCYAGYLLGRGLFAGSVDSLVEPALDIASLVLTSAVAVWAIRRPDGLRMARVFQACAIMLCAVFGAVLLEGALIGANRPQLLLGNPLNMTPLLLVPAILCSDERFAPSRFWRALGLLGFALAIITVGGISQTRGPFLVLIGLIGLRLVSGLLRPGLWSHKLANLAVVILVAGLTLASLSENSMLERFGGFAAFAETSTTGPVPQPVTPWVEVGEESMFHRLSMLQSGLAAFADRPVWGYGPQYRFEAARPYFPQGADFTYSHLHNDFVTHAVAGGLPAVVLLSLLLLSPFVLALRVQTNRRICVEMGALFSAAFIGTALVNNVLFVAIWGFALPLSLITAMLFIETLSRSNAHRTNMRTTPAPPS